MLISQMMILFKRIAIVLWFVAILAFAGEMDYQDAAFENDFYIQKVCSGEVYDYKQINPRC